MINIKKNPKEPLILREYRSSSHDAKYENAPKGMIEQILESLVAEQYGLCCYCQQRITVKNASVEHKLSQHNHKEKALDYGNMAAVCKRTEGLPRSSQYCDKFKGQKDFSFDLSNIEQLIEYEPSGIIKSSDANLDDQLNNVLNLNQRTIKKENERLLVVNRAAAYQAYVQFMCTNPTKRKVKERIDDLTNGRNGEKEEFCGVMLFFLKKRYARMK